jgi:peroxiredoxin
VPIATGAAAPDARVLSEDGSATPIAAGRAPTLLFFYRGDCAASDVAARVLPRFASIGGLRVVAVSQDEPEPTRAFAAGHGWKRLAVRRDPEPWLASRAFDVRATPTWVLIDAAGRVARFNEGWSREDANALAAEAARLAGGAPVVVSPDGGPEPAFRPG